LLEKWWSAEGLEIGYFTEDVNPVCNVEQCSRDILLRRGSVSRANKTARNGRINSSSHTAGNNRLARRNQKFLRSILPDGCRSLNSRDVIRNPERTKKVSAPRNPPGAQGVIGVITQNGQHRQSPGTIQASDVRKTS